MMKNLAAGLLAGILFSGSIFTTVSAQDAESMPVTPLFTDYEEAEEAALPDWADGSAALEKIMAFTAEVTDEDSEHYLPPKDRVAVFDFDGTLFGERFPTYLDHCLLIQRVLYDDSYKPSEETKEYALSMEEALKNHTKLPGGSAAYIADAFKGLTIDEYHACVRELLDMPVWGFEGMTYGEAFFRPMVSVVEYLAENDFAIYISTGSERHMIRETIKGTLDEWIPDDRVIGSRFALTCPGQGDTPDRDYTYAPDDQVIMAGTPSTKNLDVGKVYGIVDEIGKMPVLVFGNSSGDLAMAQYAVQNGGQAFLLLCDDTERDYGDEEVAAEFAQKCEELGFETISMKNDFAAIYQESAVKIGEEEELELAA